jgi:hypothetical protein
MAAVKLLGKPLTARGCAIGDEESSTMHAACLFLFAKTDLKA